MASPDFYKDMNSAQKILKKVKAEKEIIETHESLVNGLEELELYFEMHKSGEDDLLEEIKAVVKKIDDELSEFETAMLLSGEYDDCDAIVELHPGAGGTESQDWASMLFRMYVRFAERNDFDVEIVDYLEGEEAGIKSATFIVSGSKTYGRLKGEQGVHRLVRISPFDANARRHTSFALHGHARDRRGREH